MRCDVLTLFPSAVEAYAAVGILGRAWRSGLLDLRVHDLRRWAINRYGQVDDEAFGGGPGMVILPQVAVSAVRQVAGGEEVHVVLPDPRGRVFNHAVVAELAAKKHLIFLCGRYEGFDARVSEILHADEISIGDYVVSGGELPALVILDAVARQLPGVVGKAESVVQDSFAHGLLDFPVYTRPRVFEGQEVPAVLLSGDHGKVAAFRLRESVRLTLLRRPDLLRACWSQLPEHVRHLVGVVAEELGVVWQPPKP